MCVSSLVEADGVSGWSDTQHLAKESHEIRNNIILSRRKITLQLKMTIIACTVTVINTIQSVYTLPEAHQEKERTSRNYRKQRSISRDSLNK